MRGQYIPPALEAEAFNCPHCHVYSKQWWGYLNASEQDDGCGTNFYDGNYRVSICESCSFKTIWLEDKLIFPMHSEAEPPNPDLPEKIAIDYEEARQIAGLSPRGAAALLRLSIQKLCKHLGKPGDNINDDIKALVADGLPAKVQEALDSVRVIGNEAVHPGTIDWHDDRDIVFQLFRLVNFIAQKMLTEPKEIDDIYASIPKLKRDAIERRDA